MTDLSSPRLVPLAALLIGLAFAGCDTAGTSAASPDPTPRVGDVVVADGAVEVRHDGASARVLRASTADPVVLRAATADRFDAYFQVEVTSDEALDLDLVDETAPGAPAARLRQVAEGAGRALRFIPRAATGITVDYVSEGAVSVSERFEPADSTVVASTDEPTESVHYRRYGDQFIIIYDFTAEDPAGVVTPSGTAVKNCTEIRVRGDAAAIGDVLRPALAIGGAGWEAVRVEDGSERRLLKEGAPVERTVAP